MIYKHSHIFYKVLYTSFCYGGDEAPYNAHELGSWYSEILRT